MSSRSGRCRRGRRGFYVAAVVVDEPVVDGNCAAGSRNRIGYVERAPREWVHHVGFDGERVITRRRDNLYQGDVIRSRVVGLDSHELAIPRQQLPPQPSRRVRGGAGDARRPKEDFHAVLESQLQLVGHVRVHRPTRRNVEDVEPEQRFPVLGKRIAGVHQTQALHFGGIEPEQRRRQYEGSSRFAGPGMRVTRVEPGLYQ